MPLVSSDQETIADLLYFEPIAKTIVKLIQQADSPVTIGVHGDWGAGKSSILAMINAILTPPATEKEKPSTFCLQFNGWIFQGFQDAKTALLEGVVNQIRAERSWVKGLEAEAQSLLKRIDYFKLAKSAAGGLLTLFTGLPPGLVTAASKLLGGADVGGLIKAAQPDPLLQSILSFRAEFSKLLESANISQLVVLIDDLDRCLPKVAIETLEALRLFLLVPKTVFVIAADEGMIEYAVRDHFPGLPATTSVNDYARNYLEKLIQVPFRLPSLGNTECTVYLTLLLGALATDGSDENYKKLVTESKSILEKPWEGTGKLTELIKTQKEGVKSGLKLAETITPLIVEGTKGNPRQIKRFLNSLLLRLEVARSRGMQELVPLVLAKLMLAERFQPHFFDFIVRETLACKDGLSPVLTGLQKHVVAGEESKHLKEFEQWSNSLWVESWCKIDPDLASIDLRPYIFVSRDRKLSTFTTSSSTAETLFSSLVTSEFSVKSNQAALEALSAFDAQQLTELLFEHVRRAEKLTNRPPAILAIQTIGKAHPALQKGILAFLQSLPDSDLGSWAVAGWGECFTEESVKAEFQKAKEIWSKSETASKALKLAIGGAGGDIQRKSRAKP
jgi:predicted KAP-like P-loop ATPase